MKVQFVLPLKMICKHSVRYGRKPTDARDPIMFTDAYVLKDALLALYPDGKWPTSLTFTVEAGS